MKSIVTSLAHAALASAGYISSRDGPSLSSWLANEKTIALQGVLNNIGPSGVKVPGAARGIIVASPSTSDPDYFYTWTRDAALTAKCLIEQILAGNNNTALEGTIQDYINAQVSLQPLVTLSGSLCSGGLADPKYNVDRTAFRAPWGRPQRDGPALRATALIGYARYLLSHGGSGPVNEILWPIIQNDLSYVVQNWNQTGFDLWEEINSSSFWTTATQARALIEGQILASQIGQNCTACLSQAPQVLCFLQTYWNGAYIVSNTGGGRSGKDANSILASIHLYDPSAFCDSSTFQPCSDKALANHKVVTDSFRSIYNVNSGVPQGSAVAVGRYPEDVYQGGNPWYLCTFAAAEQLYDAVQQWKSIKSITITSISLAFFKDIYPSAAVGTYSSSSSTFSSIIGAVTAYADGYMAVAQRFTPSSGALAEQFDRANGTPLSAADLTWSYAALLTANNARDGLLPASWRAGAVKSASTCLPSSTTGPCATATKTFARPTNPPPCTATPSMTNVLFKEIVTTNYGENIYVVGNVEQLGNWSPQGGVSLSAQNYTGAQNLWFATVSLPAGIDIQYKYIRIDGNGNVRWESDPNRSLLVPKNCGGQAVQQDSWR